MNNKVVARIVRRMIDASDKSQNEIARLTGVSPSSISRYYSGNRTPSIKTLFGIANACGYFCATSEPPMEIDKVLRIFDNGLEDSINYKDTRSYIKTIHKALEIYKILAE